MAYKNKEYEVVVDVERETFRIVHKLVIDPRGRRNAKVVKFSFEALILEDDVWKQVVRFDTGEGSNTPCVHVHQFYRNAPETKRMLKWGDVNQAAKKCQFEITKKFGKYLDVYRGIV